MQYAYHSHTLNVCFGGFHFKCLVECKSNTKTQQQITGALEHSGHD